jgi:hypothetical protein
MIPLLLYLYKKAVFAYIAASGKTPKAGFSPAYYVFRSARGEKLFSLLLNRGFFRFITPLSLGIIIK